jgi:two-component system NtrC family response regulator
VEAGRFREDLYYRLNVASIKVPPLRSRRQDVSDLAHAFLQEFAARLNRPTQHMARETLVFLEQLPWKGNVRELRNAIERVVLLNNVPVLTPEHFAFLRPPARQTGGIGSNNHTFVLEVPLEGVSMNDVVRDLILKTLDLVGGNQVRAAKVLGLTRSKLRYRMEQLGIHPEQRTYKTSA